MSTARRNPLAAILLGFFAIQGALPAIPVRFLAWDDAIAARKIGFQNGRETVELQDLHPGKRSNPSAATAGEKPLQLVALDRTSPDGKPVTVAIKLDPDLKSPLVLILPDPKQPTGLRPFLIEDNHGGFGWGTVRFINTTGKALLVRHDKVIKALPEKWTPVDIAPGGAARNMGVQLVASDDRKAILYSAVWEHDPDVRKLVFIVRGTDVRTGAVEFKIIPENRRAAALATEPKSE